MSQPVELDPAPKIRFAEWAALSAAFLGWMFDGLEMGLFPLVAAPAFEDLLGDKSESVVGPWIGYVTSSFLLGAALGGLLFGWLGDRIGRVRAMSLSILVYACFTGVCYFATAPWQLVFFRFFAALGMGGEWALGVALVMEYWPGRYRPILAGLIGAASNVGFLLIAVVGLNFVDAGKSWRLMMLAGAGPALLAVLIQMFVPESRAWKSAKQHADQDPIAEIFGPKLLKHTLIGMLLGGVVLVGTWASVQWIPSWVGKELMVNAESSVKSAARSYSQIASALGAVFGCFAGALLGQLLGRRIVYFGLCILSLTLCQWLFLTTTQYSWSFLFVVFWVGFSTASFYGWLPLYLPELFPTRVRATGQGLAFNGGRILAALVALLAGQLVAQIGWAKAGAFISMIYLVGMGAIWFAPETRGKPMPE